MENQIDRDEVERLILEEGLEDKEIAGKLGCSPATIQNIRTKELKIKRKRGTNISPSTLRFLRELILNPFVAKPDMRRKVGKSATPIKKYYRSLRQRGIPVFKKNVKINNRSTVIYFLDVRKYKKHGGLNQTEE